MNPKLPLLNFSLKKLLETESNAFSRARIKILYLIILLTLFKIGIIMISALHAHQEVMQTRALFNLFFYVIILKLLLSKRLSIPAATHLLIINGIFVVWVNTFLTSQSVGIITLQFCFMVMISGFYLLDKYWGIFYSALSIIPLAAFIILAHSGSLHIDVAPEALTYPGNVFIICLNFITIITAHYLFLDAFNQNIEEKQELNRQLNESVKEANKLAQTRSDFLSVMSHELRTPLNMVIGMSELLREAPHNHEQEENLKVLSFSATNLHALINDILDFNKLESDKVTLESVSVNLYDLVYSVCVGLDMQAREKGITLVMNIDEAIRHQNVLSDPTRITQVIYNLVGNGIKFTEKGTVKLTLEIKSKTEHNTRVKFTVADTGIGITEEAQRRIFEPFIQASTSTTRSYGGTGLGLSIAKRLLALFNSTIHLESVPLKGSVFSFEVDFIPDTSYLFASTHTTGDQGLLTGLKLLAAEDNPMNTFLLKKLCIKWDIHPVLVENGTQVVRAIRQNSYDVVLMDIHMPEMDGYEASREIRNIDDPQRSDVPIIALTASISHDLELKIKEAGMNDYIRKPFHSDELFAKLKKYHHEHY